MRCLAFCLLLFTLLGCPKGPNSADSNSPSSTDTTPVDMPPGSDATPESGSTLSPETSSWSPEPVNADTPVLDPVAMGIVQKPIYTYAAKTVAYSPDGVLIAVGTGQGQVHLYDQESHELVRTIQAHENWAFDLLFSADSKKLYTGGGDNLTKIWNVEAGSELNSFADHQDDVHGVAVNKAGEMLFSGADDMQVMMRSLTDGTITTLGKHDLQVTGVSLSPGEMLLASSSRDHSVKLFDVEETMSELLTFKKHTGHVLSATFSHDSTKIVSTGNDRVARVWDVKTGEEEAAFTITGYGYSAVFSEDDRTIYTGSSDGTLNMFKLGTTESVKSLQLNSDIADLYLAPGGHELAAVTAGGELVLVDSSPETLTIKTRIRLPGAPKIVE